MDVDISTRWTSVAQESACAISELAMNHYYNWGIDNFPIMIIQPISLALFVLMADLESETNSAAFVKLCFWIHTIGRQLKVGKGILDKVEVMANEKQINLPDAAMQYFTSYRINSDDPANSDVHVEYLLAKWDDFHLDPLERP